ncbi:aminotransferase class III-fold pyridoxal phosphate-dependent enzyme [Streptomyces sp. NPDC020489]|uniref:aminotransferase class III-fold pyridoxal phosphate-dependent enzyme n=1 Tax=Streptomyces sp. NPDC020489 TaxID=3365077 RepID=UPI003789B7D2
MAETSYGGCVSEGSPRRQSAREPAARTYARALPIVPVRARGLTIEGADGRRYLDCLSGAGTLALGHNHPAVLEAIRKVLDSGAPLHAPDLVTPVEDAFVTELLRTLPPGLADHARVRFCGPSGTDAMRAAVDLVRAATGRRGVVTFTGGGRGVVGVGGVGLGVGDGDVMGVRFPRGWWGGDGGCEGACACAGAGGCGCGVGGGVGLGLGGASGEELAGPWTQLLVGGSGADAPIPAGVVVEPIQGEGEVISAPGAWMRRLRQLTADRSVPLIADEVHTGVGRTGVFWAVEHSGVTPDVMVLSKAIGGSLPLSVLAHRDDLDVREPGAPVTGNFRGNQLALAAGTATLAHVRENGLAERAALLGARMLSRLRELGERFACVGAVRGRGLMVGVELVDPAVGDGRGGGLVRSARLWGGSAGGGAPRGGAGGGAPGGAGVFRCEGAGGAGAGRAGVERGEGGGVGAGTRAAAPELAAAVQRECLRRGLIVELGGVHASVVRLLPPLTISDEQADAVLERLSEAVEAVEAMAGGKIPRVRIPHSPKKATGQTRDRPADRAPREGQPVDR